MALTFRSSLWPAHGEEHVSAETLRDVSSLTNRAEPWHEPAQGRDKENRLVVPRSRDHILEDTNDNQREVKRIKSPENNIPSTKTSLGDARA